MGVSKILKRRRYQIWNLRKLILTPFQMKKRIKLSQMVWQ